jgi:hypothetical protein
MKQVQWMDRDEQAITAELFCSQHRRRARLTPDG